MIRGPTKFEVAAFNGLGGDAIARNVTDSKDASLVLISTLSVARAKYILKQLVEPWRVQPKSYDKIDIIQNSLLKNDRMIGKLIFFKNRTHLSQFFH